MKNLIKLSLQIAKKAHKGQFRDDGKTPYITHPIAVANEFKPPKWHYYDQWSKQLMISSALLHDIFEDSSVTEDDLLKEGIDPYVVDTVRILTRKESESYLDFILRIKTKRDAVSIKIKDIEHNLSTLDPQKRAQRDKYLLALYILEH